jgi:MSHA biogenesis protein MshI
VPLNRGDYKIMVLPEPPVDPAEMAQSVRWSLGTMIDYPVEEAVVDWMSIPTRKQLPTRPPHLYAIVARSDVVNQRVEPFRRAKIDVSAVDIRETAYRKYRGARRPPG